EGEAAPVAAAAEVVQEAPKPVIDAEGAVAAAMQDESRPPRKRRRRRRGQRVEGAPEAATNGNGHGEGRGQPREAKGAAKPPRAQAAPRSSDAPAAPESSLLSRIGARLRKLVTRAPQSQH
ncbi:MAG TPA: hypothetical protein PLF73_09660, partial [Luteimonas sp.]|nr:hypothetical protein [Luteimonas sp.]